MVSSLSLTPWLIFIFVPPKFCVGTQARQVNELRCPLDSEQIQCPFDSPPEAPHVYSTILKSLVRHTKRTEYSLSMHASHRSVWIT
jgi:hypothetical protein